MSAFARLLTTISLAIAVSAGVTSNIVPPASRGQWNPPTVDLSTTFTDTDTIVATAQIVDQKAGAVGAPNQPVPETTITAVDGQLTTAGSSNSTTTGDDSTASTRRRSVGFARAHAHAHGKHLSQRAPLIDYEEIFSGIGGPNDKAARDASIQGTAYLTFTLVNNATYNINDCLTFCSNVQGCVFANLYYEFNNDALDFHETSNLKCAVYGDVHTAAEKTNFGGQQLEAAPAGLTYIQQSSGWTTKFIDNPDTPEGYDLAYGPSTGANNAPGYMGFVFLDRYDVDACAAECNKRGADGQGGACQYFNIWRAVVDGSPTTYSCSLYYIPSDDSTATNYGQGDLQVTAARGYQRKNLLQDGGFESFNQCTDFCFSSTDSNWIGTSPINGTLDASIFYYQPYAHSGNAVGLLGSAPGTDGLSGTLKAIDPLDTVAGKNYQINFFHASAFSGPSLEGKALVQVLWNGEVVQTITPGFQNWQLYQVEVVAKGQDTLAFHGGAAPAWSFIDDVTVFAL